MEPRAVRIERTFPAPPEAVWRAWTDPAWLSRWFGSDPAGIVNHAALDVMPGGPYEITFHDSDGTEHTCSGTYLDVRPQRRLEFTWTWKSEPGSESLVTVHLEPEADGTRMHFEHARLMPGSAHDYEAGWSRTFVKLERLLEAMPQPLIPDSDFPAYVADALAGLPGVEAVMLGGSRAYGMPGPDADWDFSLYYRRSFDVEALRALGWPGEVHALGAWGGGVFNGGAWLRIDGRKVDVHYRDLEDVEHRIREAAQGRFAIEHLMFHLAGIPTYIVVGELALGRVLAGRLPRPEYPAALRASASRRWLEQARMTLAYAEAAYAPRGDIIGLAGAAARALIEAGHGRLAARGIWVTNEKTLLAQAGLAPAAESFRNLDADPAILRDRLRRIRELIESPESGI